jgi:hypothetical protein
MRKQLYVWTDVGQNQYYLSEKFLPHSCRVGGGTRVIEEKIELELEEGGEGTTDERRRTLIKAVMKASEGGRRKDLAQRAQSKAEVRDRDRRTEPGKKRSEILHPLRGFRMTAPGAAWRGAKKISQDAVDC